MKYTIKKILCVGLLLVSPYGFAVTDKVQCASNGIDYKGVKTLITHLQQAIARDDKNQVAQLASYPVRINQASGSALVSGKKQLIYQYKALFNPSLKEKIRAINPDDIFCNWQGAMVADGILWLRSGKKPGFFVINVP